MTAVMRRADARLKASSMRSSSIRWSLVGVQIDWMTKTSPPRTFSVISTCTSPSLNRPTSAWPSGTPTYRAIASASGGLAFPANILISSFIDADVRFPRAFPRIGREGLEPSLPDPKSGALPAWRPPTCRRRHLRETRHARFCSVRCQPYRAPTGRRIAGPGTVWKKIAVRAFERVAHAAAARAGALLRSRYRERQEVSFKSEVDLVTATDRDAERLIVDRIRAAFPAHGIVAEESAPLAAEASHRWYIDPLDGTTNFVHGYPHFAVSIALAHGDELLLGLVY